LRPLLPGTRIWPTKGALTVVAPPGATSTEVPGARTLVAPVLWFASTAVPGAETAVPAWFETAVVPGAFTWGWGGGGGQGQKGKRVTVKIDTRVCVCVCPCTPQQSASIREDPACSTKCLFLAPSLLLQRPCSRVQPTVVFVPLESVWVLTWVPAGAFTCTRGGGGGVGTR
jgi:hypothetical protein